MSAINYSKWDNIEISDDEDDTHPNIHTPSLFKWRHEARVKRMDEMQSEKGERLNFGFFWLSSIIYESALFELIYAKQFFSKQN